MNDDDGTQGGTLDHTLGHTLGRAPGGTAPLRLLTAVAVGVFALLGAQTLRMQVFDPAVPASMRAGIPRVDAIPAPRGLITDRTGTVVASNVPRYRIALVPGELPKDAAARVEVLQRIAAVTRIPAVDLYEAATTGLALVDPHAPVVVRDRVSGLDAILFRAALADVPAARVEVTASRTYDPTGALAHVLGYVGALPADRAAALVAEGYPLDARIGLAGVEARYEQALRGTPGRRLVIADPTGRVLREAGVEPATPGANVVLSIDARLQRATAAALQRGMDRGLSVARTNTGQARPAPAAGGAAAVVDVRTGELLAMVSLPSYDPNLFDGAGDAGAHADALARIFADPARPLVDRTYMEVHAPGSIFKPLVALAALEEGVATPSTRIFSGGAISVRDEYRPDVYYTFRDWMAHGDLDLIGAIARSSDVYFYELAGGYSEDGRVLFRGLGADHLSRWARAAGLGRRTGIDLPGEAAGLVPDTRWKERTVGDPWVLGDTYTYGIGQGYLTTSPIQMAMLTAAIANGGDLLVPHVVRGVEVRGTFTATPTRITARLPGSAANYEVVRRGMAAAAAPAGTANTGAPAGVPIGGKTGTAEFGQAYPDGQYDTHGWYIGFAPYERPQIAVAVYLEYGVGQTHAGPVAREILEEYLRLDGGLSNPNPSSTSRALR